ncbi:ATP-binding protein [Streptomyces fulvoviolaceus]|uniref:ATP-binding protein n=1 Tax=Streptomyces fulvoviolaceus TaxID=285535 RepID=UPI0007C579AD|nr:ATP-binding protein [Streptomyces fulvoviolaceus]
MQELIGRRKRAGFVGRRSELDLFRANFDASPEDERHSFVFHIHGAAGVGKSSLIRELQAVAAQRKALTACTDETVNSVPEAMAAISAQCARQGAELKALDKLLATYRQRRHEAETASAALEVGPDPGLPASPSPGSMAVSQAGLIGLGMVPVVGAFAGAIDPAQVAHGTDRLRAALSARFRNHDDGQLVLEPLKVLTPVFVAELDRVAADVPWVVLFFDTYERTAPFLDPWLLDLITTDRYGALPANVVVTLAGQHGPDPARWADYAGFVAEFPLEPFTESEVRQLLAAKRVVDEDVVREVLRLSGGLPVLVSTLAENSGAIDDPTATAVERFLKSERDPVRREVAIACALPRWLDKDGFRAAVDGETGGSYEWLRGLPFVSERAGRVHYHDVVRTAMLRLERTRSPRQWTERHARLAEVYGGWRAEAEEGLEPDKLWFDESWRELRLEESYHLLSARPQTVLGQVLRDVVDACRAGEVAARGCAQVLLDAGEQADAAGLHGWGHDLLVALSAESEGSLLVLGLLLDRAGLDAFGRAEAHCVRGQELRSKGEHDRALVEYDRALVLNPESAEAYHGRGVTRRRAGDAVAALVDFDRADELHPDNVRIIFDRGEVLRTLGRHEEAAEAFDRVLALDPTHEVAWASRAYSKHSLGDDDGALADFDRALEIDDEYLWALVHRAEVYRRLGRLAKSFADLDRAVEIAPEDAWVASERGDAYRLVSRYEEAVEELGRACELDPEYDSAHAGRGYALVRLNRPEEARAAFDRAIELDPTYVWALVQRARLRRDLGDAQGMWADLDRAVSAAVPGGWALGQRGIVYADACRYEEALADYDLALERSPDLAWVRALRTEALTSLGRGDEAMAELDRALELGPDDADTLEVRGRARLRRSQYLEALRDLDRALSLRPNNASLYVARASTCISIGRLDQAFADLRQCLERGDAVEWARGRAVDVLLWKGRYGEAVRLLDSMRAIAEPKGDSATMFACWFADVITGRWGHARQAADWLQTNRPERGVPMLALVVGTKEGLSAAKPLWREVRRLALAEVAPDIINVLIGYAQGDWARADTLFSEVLTQDHDWEDLADLAHFLTLLARCRDADPALFGPRLARVVAARDAVQARYAE